MWQRIQGGGSGSAKLWEIELALGSMITKDLTALADNPLDFTPNVLQVMLGTSEGFENLFSIHYFDDAQSTTQVRVFNPSANPSVAWRDLSSDYTPIKSATTIKNTASGTRYYKIIAFKRE